jgi:hypothetical protein
MALCVLCAQPTHGAEAFCGFHVHGHGDDWATANRTMCDFLHRGIVRPPPAGRPDALDVPIEILDEALVP